MISNSIALCILDGLILQNDILIGWLLSFNVKFYILTGTVAPLTTCMVIAGTQLELFDNIHDLGIQIDSNYNSKFTQI